MTRRLVTRSLFIAVGVTCLVESSWGYAVAFGGNDHAAMPVTSSALYQFKPRYYSAALKRFATADPIGLESGLNLYVYGSDNPLAFLDPLGLCAQLSQGVPNAGIAANSGSVLSAPPMSAAEKLANSTALLGSNIDAARPGPFIVQYNAGPIAIAAVAAVAAPGATWLNYGVAAQTAPLVLQQLTGQSTVGGALTVLVAKSSTGTLGLFALVGEVYVQGSQALEAVRQAVAIAAVNSGGTTWSGTTQNRVDRVAVNAWQR